MAIRAKVAAFLSSLWAGAPRSQTIVRRLESRYDAAQTTDDNYRHWANADSLSPAAALQPEIRRTLRDRCRYEVANNSYAKGIGLTIANDTVGIGPALQLVSGEKSLNKKYEGLFWDWMQEIRLPEKLRQMRFARYDSGECFAVFVNNPSLKGPIKLDIKVYEAEQIADPTFVPLETAKDHELVDGIRYDRYGNPTVYHKLRRHPGATDYFGSFGESDPIKADAVFHYFRQDRPAQPRGIPDITPAIGAFAELRKFAKATIAAASTAARHSAVVKTTAPPDGDGAAAQTGTMPTTWDKVQLEDDGGLVLPEGWEITQLKAEHPGTNYTQFEMSKLREISRCLCVPIHIAAMDPSIANMSSSYVVGQMYAQERIVDRSELERLLDRAEEKFRFEASLNPETAEFVPTNTVHAWFWPSLGHHADPQKVANAAATRLANGLGSIPHEYGLFGQDWEEQQNLAAKSFGVTLEEYREMLRTKIFVAKQAENPAENTQNNEKTPENEGEENANDSTGAR